MLIQNILGAMIKDGSLPKSAASTIYVVFLDPEMRSTLGSMFAGKHYAAYHNFFNAGGMKLHYVVVPFEADRTTATQDRVSRAGRRGPQSYGRDCELERSGPSSTKLPGGSSLCFISLARLVDHPTFCFAIDGWPLVDISFRLVTPTGWSSEPAAAFHLAPAFERNTSDSVALCNSCVVGLY